MDMCIYIYIYIYIYICIHIYTSPDADTDPTIDINTYCALYKKVYMLYTIYCMLYYILYTTYYILYTKYTHMLLAINMFVDTDTGIVRPRYKYRYGRKGRET